MTVTSGRQDLIPGPLFVDAHAHFHRAFELAAFLSAATRNVAAAAAERGLTGQRPAGVLLLAESQHEEAFARIEAVRTVPPHWAIHPTAEPESLLVRESGRVALIVIAGRQIVTAEGVEILALLSREQFADRNPLAETMSDIRRAGAVPVLPWGFGKWTMRRGALVSSVFRSAAGEVFLGDNGGRLAAGPTPRLLREARRRTAPVLPGSDPLPFRDQQSRIAAYGFVAGVAVEEDRPASGLRSWLRALEAQPPTYGHLETLGRFIRNQARMQWRKRVARAD